MKAPSRLDPVLIFSILFLMLTLSGCGASATATAEPAQVPAPVISVTPQEFPGGYIKAQGKSLVNSLSGELFRFHSVNFSHDPIQVDYEDAHRLGFNSVRLVLQPGPISQGDFTWLDRQVAWARLSGMYLILGVNPDQPFQAAGQEQVVTFWKTLAGHYAQENSIAGYDLLQEPQPNSLDEWQTLAGQAARAIRASDSNHLLIVQGTRSPDRTFIYLDDDNYMLGLLYFKPFEFTAQAQGQYPSEAPFRPDWSYFGLAEYTRNESVSPGTSLWTETNSPLFQINGRDTVVGFPGVSCTLVSGEVYFSNFEVNEYDENQEFVRQVMAIDQVKNVDFWGPWTDGPGLTITRVNGSPWGETEGKSIRFSRPEGDTPVSGTVTDPKYAFEPVLGHFYTIHGWLRGVEVNPGARCQFNIEFWTYTGYDQLVGWDRAHLQSDLSKLAAYGSYHNLPMMALEFGVSRAAFKSGGAQWMTDVLDIFDDLGWNLGYRSYRDDTWGIYPLDVTQPSNSELVAALDRPEISLPPGTPSTKLPPLSPLPEGFVHARGQDLVVGDQVIHLRGTNFSSQTFTGKYQSVEHSQRDFALVRRMGMNVIRFNVTYQFFESEDAPYQYDPQAFEWLDQQIAWAREAGIYLILNMHYVPGQYETGMLLSTPDDQARAVALWKALAERYRDENTIAGYDLINEPIGISATDYQILAQKLVDGIREVDKNHMIVVEAINDYFTPAFVMVDDDNVMYDFHFYRPDALRAENGMGTPPTGVYPDVTYLELSWNNGLQYRGRISAPKLPAGTSDWQLLESPIQAPASSGKGITWGYPNAFCEGGKGTAYFGDFQVRSFDSAGNPLDVILDMKIDRTTKRYNGSSNNLAQFGMSPDNPLGTPDGRSLLISYSGGNASSEFVRYAFEATPGNKYQISGWVRGADISGSAKCQYVLQWFQYPPGETLFRHNRDYLADGIDFGVRFGKEHNVPINVGEFGLMDTNFTDKRGGLVWLNDVMDLLIEKNINFTQWAYWGSMGFYGDESHYPDAALFRQPLVEVFVEKLNQSGLKK